MTSDKSNMWTTFLGRRSFLLPRISQEYLGKTEKENLEPWRTPKSAGWYWNFLPLVFSLPALCPEGNTLVVSLTSLSQPQLCTEPFWGVAFYSYQRLGRCTILVLLPHLILIDHRLMRLSNGALRCVEWNFGKWKVHVHMYIARCGKIWDTSATSILKNILYMYSIYM